MQVDVQRVAAKSHQQPEKTGPLWDQTVKELREFIRYMQDKGVKVAPKSHRKSDLIDAVQQAERGQSETRKPRGKPPAPPAGGASAAPAKAKSKVPAAPAAASNPTGGPRRRVAKLPSGQRKKIVKQKWADHGIADPQEQRQWKKALKVFPDPRYLAEIAGQLKQQRVDPGNLAGRPLPELMNTLANLGVRVKPRAVDPADIPPPKRVPSPVITGELERGLGQGSMAGPFEANLMRSLDLLRRYPPQAPQHNSMGHLYQQLRKRFPSLSAEQFEDAMRQLENRDVIRFGRADSPSSIADEVGRQHAFEDRGKLVDRFRLTEAGERHLEAAENWQKENPDWQKQLPGKPFRPWFKGENPAVDMLIKHGDKYLVIRRGADTLFDGGVIEGSMAWPGGFIDPDTENTGVKGSSTNPPVHPIAEGKGEDAETAAWRELVEETNLPQEELQAAGGRLRALSKRGDDRSWDRRVPHGHESYITSRPFVYELPADATLPLDAVMSEGFDDATWKGWVSADDLRNMEMFAGHSQILEEAEGRSAKEAGQMRFDHINTERVARMAADQLPGGLADEKGDAEFPPAALAEGQRVEMEHTDDPQLAREIAKDHLTEREDYYERLKQVEASGRLIDAARVARLVCAGAADSGGRERLFGKRNEADEAEAVTEEQCHSQGRGFVPKTDKRRAHCRGTYKPGEGSSPAAEAVEAADPQAIIDRAMEVAQRVPQEEAKAQAEEALLSGDADKIKAFVESDAGVALAAAQFAQTVATDTFRGTMTFIGKVSSQLWRDFTQAPVETMARWGLMTTQYSLAVGIGVAAGAATSPVLGVGLGLAGVTWATLMSIDTLQEFFGEEKHWADWFRTPREKALAKEKREQKKEEKARKKREKIDREFEPWTKKPGTEKSASVRRVAVAARMPEIDKEAIVEGLRVIKRVDEAGKLRPFEQAVQRLIVQVLATRRSMPLVEVMKRAAQAVL